MHAFLKTHLKLASFSDRFFMKFHDFLGIDFRIDFFIVFWWKRVPKWGQNLVLQMSKLSLADDFFATLSFMLILCWIWLTLGSLLAPVGSLLAPAGSLLAPFGSLLAHFWCPLAHFWCPFLHFCSPRDPFSHFCCILSSFFVSFWIFHENIVQNLILK